LNSVCEKAPVALTMGAFLDKITDSVIISGSKAGLSRALDL